jgi:hypothetical protein
MGNMTMKDLDVISDVLVGEEMACKKARMYANTLTDASLASMMNELASSHEKRYNEIFSLISQQ